MKLDEFSADFTKLCNKYKIYPSGSLRLVDATDSNVESFSIGTAKERYVGAVKDKTGPFMTCNVNYRQPKPVNCNTGLRVQVSSDIAGYDCPVTGKWIDGRRDHRENLKRQGCRNLEVGESRDAQKNIERETNAFCKTMAHDMVMTAVKQLDL